MSTIPRLFTESELHEGAEIASAPGQGHYLGAVLRRGPGDALRLFNGRDGEWAAELVNLRKDVARIAVQQRLRPPRPEPDLRLVVAVVKRDAMEWIVEKATELGAASIAPVLTRRTVADRVNLARLTLIAREAAEQCERLTLPAIAEARPLHALLDAWDGAPLLLGEPRGEARPIAAALAGLAPPLGWLVGPEGGFERAELDDLRRRPFVAPVRLGPRILRAETAAAAGLSAIQALAGDWTETHLPGENAAS